MPRKATPVRVPGRPASRAHRGDGRVLCIRYTQKVAREICERIAEGQVWFRICNTGKLPSYGTLFRWLQRYPDFAEAYEQAREIAAEQRADKALVVAEGATPATVTCDRLHVSTLQWHATRAGGQGRYGGWGKEGKDKLGPARLIIEVRQFERVVRDDGTVYVRELERSPAADGDSR
jgi:hypothetical protein